MHSYKQLFKNAKPGQIIPIVREVDMGCPVKFFAKLSDYGRKKDSLLFESRDHLSDSTHGELTFGTASPALYLTGRGTEFSIRALTSTGKRMLKYLASDKSRFDFCKTNDYTDEENTGTPWRLAA